MSCAASQERLMACVKKPTKNVCAEEFLDMRECSRNGGKYVTFSEDRLEITSEGNKVFSAEAKEHLGASAVPANSFESMKSAGETMMKM